MTLFWRTVYSGGSLKEYRRIRQVLDTCDIEYECEEKHEGDVLPPLRRYLRRQACKAGTHRIVETPNRPIHYTIEVRRRDLARVTTLLQVWANAA